MPPEEQNLEQAINDNTLISKKIGEETNQLLETIVKQTMDKEEPQLLEDSLVIQSKILAEVKKSNELAQKSFDKEVPEPPEMPKADFTETNNLLKQLIDCTEKPAIVRLVID